MPGTQCDVVTRRAKVLGRYGPSLSMDMSEWVEDTMVPHQTMSPPSRNHPGALIQQYSVERMFCRSIENREKQRLSPHFAHPARIFT